MTALAGGAADKTGNRYEHLWTALRVADLLQGEASRLRLEPPGDDGVGIEFEIDISGFTWGEQTKDSSETWTINRLKADGVLASAKHQIGLGRRFRLIASSAATALDTLSGRARVTDTLAEFKGTLTTKLEPDFEDLVKHWDVTDEKGWRLLKLVKVEQHTLVSLRRNARLAYRILYADDPDLVIAEIRAFCDVHLHDTITAPRVAAHLESKGFRGRLLVHDDDARRRLHRTVERQRRRVQRTTPQFGLVQRPEVEAIVVDLQDPAAPQVVIVDGPAGYGKSAVVAEVASTLEAEGWFVAVARMDVDSATSTSDHLGSQMGLAESPAVLLAGVADGSPALLVVDQLDAVSLFSGRMPDSFEAVEDLLSEIRRAPNIKVLLVCRTVDLENDQRLRSLLRAKGTANRHTLDKLVADHVREHLSAHGMHVPAAETVQLLRTPLHLAVYERLSEEARQQRYRTLQDLYDQLTPEVRRRAEQRAVHLDWAGTTSALVKYMSENETLTAPRTLLDRFAVDGIAALESEAILVSDDAGFAFFHESYFDYLFARAFVDGGGDPHDFLATTGQFLFRRAQTRQVLEFLAATDRAAFRDVTAQLLASAAIRSHLKHAVVGLLRQITPTPEDWAAIEDVAWGDTPIAWPLLTLLSDPGWFDAADALGRWEQWLAEDDRVEHAAHQLVFAARQRAERVAELVRPYVGTSEDWRLRLRALMAWSLTSGLVPLAVELIEGGHIDDARGPIAVNSDFWSILHALEDDDASGAARVIGAFLRRGQARARAAGSDDPFESDHLATHSPSGDVIRKVALNAPEGFVHEVLPFVINVALADQHARDELLPVSGRWRLRYRGSDHGVDDILFAATEGALRQLGADAPERAVAAVAGLRGVESDEVRLLVCRTLTALNDSDNAISWLLGDTRNLVLGWADSAHWASRELIEAHSPRCSDELHEQLEAAILAYRSKYERGAVGHGQYALLSALDAARMSENARRRLGELERRFPGPPPEPRPVTASFVGSPIGDDASKRMSDENWLAALRKHNTEKTDWRGDFPVGGASQLAGVLAQRASEEPERFARLALQFDASIPAIAIAHVVRAVRSSVNVDLLTDVCEYAAKLYGEEVGREVCSAVESIRDVNERLVALIERYAAASDPDREWARTDAGRGTTYFGGDLFHAGLNSTRGEAALAAAAALFAGANHVDRLRPVVALLAVDDNLGVRTCAAEAVVALLNHDNDAALGLAERLFDAPIDLFDAHTSERLLLHCVLRAPERFVVHLQGAIDGPPHVATRAGRVWAVANFRGANASSLSDDVRALPPPARVGAAEVLAENVADTAQQLSVLFNDPDAGVRKAASRGMRNISEVAADALDPLIERFAGSTAFADHMDGLIDALEKFGTKLPPSTLRVCAMAVEIGGRELGDISSARSVIGTDLIAVVLRLYRQADRQTRAVCLNIIDRLVEINAYGIDKALADER
jgi:hypothetical protein